eukprot:738263-Rhodomonas_salina.1
MEGPAQPVVRAGVPTQSRRDDNRSGGITPHHRDQPAELRLCHDDDAEGQDIRLRVGNADDWDSKRVGTIGTQTCCKGLQCS